MHKPERTCIGCRIKKDKESLIKITKTGRGVYVCSTECLEKVKKSKKLRGVIFE